MDNDAEINRCTDKQSQAIASSNEIHLTYFNDTLNNKTICPTNNFNGSDNTEHLHANFNKLTECLNNTENKTSSINVIQDCDNYTIPRNAVEFSKSSPVNDIDLTKTFEKSMHLETDFSEKLDTVSVANDEIIKEIEEQTNYIDKSTSDEAKRSTIIFFCENLDELKENIPIPEFSQ